MKREHTDLNGDEDILALLREVGAGHEPSAAAAEEVRRAVHEEWRATVAQRKRRNRVVTFGIAASVALVLVVASWALRFAAPQSDLPVTIARIDGEARLQSSPGDPVRAINVGEGLAVGAVIMTDDGTRIALAYGTGVSMRVDRGSTIQRVSADRFRLSAGAVYIDAQSQASGHELVIETLAGEVRHLGTQYQVRQANEVVEVSIREGRVEIASSKGAALASAGERVRINAAGQIDRGAISAQDPAWNWAEAASPPFAIDDRTVAEFLEWVARETGRRIAYASPEAQRVAETVRLRGSVEGLDPDTALSAVLSTTEFETYETGDGLIGVRLTSSGQPR
jgi:ferric-dicitrate binding protein FerR (iron transport regulator)